MHSHLNLNMNLGVNSDRRASGVERSWSLHNEPLAPELWLYLSLGGAACQPRPKDSS